MGRPIVHFEIAAPNLDTATEFYKRTLGAEEFRVPRGRSRAHGSPRAEQHLLACIGYAKAWKPAAQLE